MEESIYISLVHLVIDAVVDSFYDLSLIEKDLAASHRTGSQTGNNSAFTQAFISKAEREETGQIFHTKYLHRAIGARHFPRLLKNLLL